MPSDFFDIDFGRLVRWNTPVKKRLPKILARLYGGVYGCVYVFQNFLLFKKAKLYQLMITPQVCYLKRLLNDRYDYSSRRILIVDAIWFTAWYIYQEDELKPEYLYTEAENNPVALYNDNEAGEIKDDFVVLVPNDVVFDESEMRSVIDSYRLAGKKYKIQLVAA